jgi:APA family basic amino acid/polyamine antiporter
MALKRVLGTGDAAWIVAGNMIGAGIFVMPGQAAARLPGAAWILAAWLAGGLLSLAGAMVYGELGSRHPRSGGDYRYLHEAFGPLPAFLSGWAAFLLTFSAAAAAMCITALDHLRAAFPSLAGLRGWPAGLAAAAIVLLLTRANAAGARVSGLATVLMTALPLAGLAALFGIGFATGSEAVAAPDHPFAAPSGSWMAAFGGALVPIFFTYSGWNAAAYLGGEMKDASRSLPRALLLGTALVTCLYLAVNAVLLAVIPAADLAGSVTPVADAARSLMGPLADRLMALVIAVAILGSANVTLMAGARIYYAMASDGLCPRGLARLNAAGVPSAALWTSGVWTALLALTGQFERLFSWATLAILLLSSLTAAALFRLRRGTPSGKIYRCPFYPVTPIVYLATSLGVAVSSYLYDPASALSGLALVLLGIPAFFLIRRRGARDKA